MEILVESALHEARNCLAVFNETERKPVATHRWDPDGRRDPVEHSRWWRQVSVAGTEIYDVDAARDQLALLFGNLGEGVLGQAEQTICVRGHYRLSCTGLLTRLTPGISIST